MSERRSFYRIIRRMKTFKKDVFHPSSKRNNFLEMKVTFDRSKSRKIFMRQVMAVLQRHVEAKATIHFVEKRRVTEITVGKLFPSAFLSHKGMFLKCHVVFLSDQLCILFRMVFGYFS